MLGAVGAASVDAYACLARLIAVGERVGLFVDRALPAPGFSVVSDVPLLQMVRADEAVVPAADDESIVAPRPTCRKLALTARTKRPVPPAYLRDG